MRSGRVGVQDPLLETKDEMEPTSKSFRAILPILNDTQLSELRQWAATNYAAAVVLTEYECVVLLATRERSKTKEAFMRSVRRTMRLLNIDTGALKRRWLALTTDRAVGAEATEWSQGRAQMGVAMPTVDTTPADRPAKPPSNECEEKVMFLHGTAGKSSHDGSTLLVTKA